MGRVWLAFLTCLYPIRAVYYGPILTRPYCGTCSLYQPILLYHCFFWYTGLLPDIARCVARAKGLRRRICSLLSFGWRGTAKEWQRFESLSLVLAGLSTPLVLSVHSIVSFDFATSVVRDGTQLYFLLIL